MADIRVERRDRGAAWLWILIALLAVVAAIWFFSTLSAAESAAADADVTVPMDSVSFSPDARMPPPLRAA